MSVGKQANCCCRCQAYYIIRVGLGSAHSAYPSALAPFAFPSAPASSCFLPSGSFLIQLKLAHGHADAFDVALA